MLTITEENYLKAIYKLSVNQMDNISTNSIAGETQTTAASVTDMLKRLAEKDLIAYEKYKGVSLTGKGNEMAVQLIRNHRLWEVFLVQKLGFDWHQVHDIAEELEHIKSTLLIDRLDAFLGHPAYDPHGDPIPNSNGYIPIQNVQTLSQIEIGKSVTIVGVNEQSTNFLKYLDRLQLGIGSRIEVVENNTYDNSKIVVLSNGEKAFLSDKICSNIVVQLAA